MFHQSLIYLGVNIDHIATLRQARLTRFPDPVEAALLAEKAGADGITAHLREDRRHIQDRDILRLKEMLDTRLNLEMAVTDEMINIARQTQPFACCLVPEKRQELTTEGGLDVVNQLAKIRAACEQLGEKDIEVSLFIDPDRAQIDAALAAGAPVVEFHTGCYATATGAELQAEFLRVQESARYAHQKGLQVNGGHGLNYHNVEAISQIPEMVELNIGHAIIARSVFVGLFDAVKEMKRLMRDARLQAQTIKTDDL